MRITGDWLHVIEVHLENGMVANVTLLRLFGLNLQLTSIVKLINFRNNRCINYYLFKIINFQSCIEYFQLVSKANCVYCFGRSNTG